MLIAILTEYLMIYNVVLLFIFILTKKLYLYTHGEKYRYY